jgi:uncharacterized protein (TIGR03437 family)
MLRVLATAFFACALAQAQSTTLSVNAILTTTNSTTYSAAGTATLTGAVAANGTFSATLNLTTIATGGSTPFTLTFSGGTITGSLTIPLAALEAILGGQTSASGLSATISGGTGSYAGATGSFQNISGSGSLGATGNVTLNFSGTGTITISSSGGTPPPPTPTITAVQDDASYTSNIAQGSLFVVKGSNLSASGYTSLPLPYATSSGTTSITFTPAAGGTGTQAYLFYTYNENGVNQLGGILPSTLKTGSYNVTVTYNNATSAPFATQVVSAKPAIFTQDTTGTGLAVVQNIVSATEYDVNRLTTGVVAGTTISPAKPGQTLIVWATGLGPVPYPDNNVPTEAYNYPGVQVIVGGTSITPLYAGASGYAGLDQINITLPASITAGCTVSLQISVNGTLSAATTIAIAPSASASACVLPGYTNTQLAALDNGSTITSGGFSITSFTENIQGEGNFTFNSVGGGFSQVTGFQLAALPVSYSSLTVGSCTVIQVSGTASGLSVGGTVTNLDAGAVTISGPSGSSLSATPLVETSNSYSLTIGSIAGITLPGSVNGSIVAGTYNLNGAGGKGVGSFGTSLTLGTPLTVTGGLPTTINRSQPLALSWTGGNATDPVAIIGYSGNTTGSGANPTITATEFICTTTAGAGTFSVPTQVLGQLPATASTLNGGAGFIEVGSGPTPASFNASLIGQSQSVAATFSALIATAGSATYQ